MTDPSQYFKGRTVQEQMTEVIGYVDTRAAEVATDAIASDVAQVHQDMLDADADASAAAASAAAAAGTLANAVKKTGESSQSIAGDISVSGTLTGNVVTGTTITAPTPVNNTDAATKKYVDDADALKLDIADVDQYAVGLTGNQDVAGIKTFVTPPILVLGAGGKRIASTEYLKIGTINNTNDNSYVVGLIIMERGGIVIGNVGITVTGGAVSAVSLTGTTLVGTATRIFVGAALTVDGIEIYCHPDTSNRFFSAIILGCFVGAGIPQSITPALEVESSTPSGYVEAQFTEA